MHQIRHDVVLIKGHDYASEETAIRSRRVRRTRPSGANEREAEERGDTLQFSQLNTRRRSDKYPSVRKPVARVKTAKRRPRGREVLTRAPLLPQKNQESERRRC